MFNHFVFCSVRNHVDNLLVNGYHQAAIDSSKDALTRLTCFFLSYTHLYDKVIGHVFGSISPNLVGVHPINKLILVRKSADG